jgi:hypothetical protein
LLLFPAKKKNQANGGVKCKGYQEEEREENKERRRGGK